MATPALDKWAAERGKVRHRRGVAGCPDGRLLKGIALEDWYIARHR
jgi:hypothetical protein